MLDEFVLLKLNRSVWVSLLRQGKTMEGINYFEMYINNLATLLKKEDIKQKVEAEIKYSNATFVIELQNILKISVERKDFSRGAICLTALMKYVKIDNSVIKNGITCLNGIKQYDIADDLVIHLENLSKDDPAVLRDIAAMYADRDCPIKAVEYFEKYLANKSTLPAALDYNYLGCYYHRLYDENQSLEDNMKRAIINFQKAVELDPQSLLFAKNTTIVMTKFNEYEECQKYWDILLKSGRMNNDDKFDYAAYCLHQGDFAGWHKYFGFRFQKEHNATEFPKIQKKQWDGKRDISNSVLLVHFEQGYGDTFLMYGYLPRLQKLAKKVIYVVQDQVYPLLKDNEYGIEIIPAAATKTVGLENIKFDYYIPSMSIPAALNLTRDNISVGEGYIKTPSDLVERFRSRYMDDSKFKIAICTGGSKDGDLTRDISPDDLLPLNELENVQLFSVMKDGKPDMFKRFTKNKVIQLNEQITSFAETAAIIENMDLVLTSDNVILNLAGALGKKTFALFNWHNQFRYFDLSGDNVVWYTSVKPFVNDKQNNWSCSVNKAVEEIKTML